MEECFWAEPDITAKALMQRLREQFPDVYPTGAQLRTLQRRVQLWRNEQVKRLIFESTGVATNGPEATPESQNVEITTTLEEAKF